jgi:hypothetical protein
MQSAWFGTGLLQVRFRMEIPPPHETVQGL